MRNEYPPPYRSWVSWKNRASCLITGAVLFILLPIALQAQTPSPKEWKDRYVSLWDSTMSSHNPAIAREDTNAYTVVAYEKTSQQSNWTEIWIQAIEDNQGTPLWRNTATVDQYSGMPVCAVTSVAVNPRAAFDQGVFGQGLGKGVIVVWEDNRSGVYQIYAQRIDLQTGAPTWQVNGVQISQGNGPALRPRIVGTGNGAYITWTDYSNNPNQGDIFVDYIDAATGASFWAGPVGVCVGNWTAQNSEIALDGAISTNPGVYIAWEDSRNGNNSDIYCEHVSPAGTLLTGGTNAVVTNANGNQFDVQVVAGFKAGVPGFLATWNDQRNGVIDVYMQYIVQVPPPVFLGPGPGWPAVGTDLAISTVAGSNQQNPRIEAIAYQTGGGMMQVGLLAWEDHRAAAPSPDIYAAMVNIITATPVTTAPWAANGRPILQLGTCAGAIAIDVYGTDCFGSVNFVIGWEDNRTVSDVYFQEIDLINNGALLWQVNGQPLTLAKGNQAKVQVAENVFVFEDMRRVDTTIYAQKIGCTCDDSTYTAWRDVYAKHTNATTAFEQRMVTDEDGFSYVVWSEDRDNTYYGREIYVQKFDVDGVPLWNNDGLLISDINEDSQQPDICVDDSGGCYVVWQRRTAAYATYVIEARRVAGNGTVPSPWSTSRFFVGTQGTNDYQVPKVVEDDQGGFNLVFKDNATGYLHYRRVDAGQNVIGAGQINNNLASNYGSHKICKDGQNGCIIAWVNYSGGSFTWVAGVAINNQTRFNSIQSWGTSSGGFDLSWSERSQYAWFACAAKLPNDTYQEIYVVELYEQLLPLWIAPKPGASFFKVTNYSQSSPSWNAANPTIVTDLVGNVGTGCIVTWDKTDNYGNKGIDLQRVNDTYNIYWPSGPLNIRLGSTVRMPKICNVANAADSSVIIAWLDERSCFDEPNIQSVWAQSVKYSDPNMNSAPNWPNVKEISPQKGIRYDHVIKQTFAYDHVTGGSANLTWHWDTQGQVQVAGTRLMNNGLLGKKGHDIAEQKTSARFDLHPVYPNPFGERSYSGTDVTNISFTLSNDAEVTLKIFNVLGKEVAKIEEGRLEAGTHIRQFRAGNLSGGLYYLWMYTNGMVQTRKMLLLK